MHVMSTRQPWTLFLLFMFVFMSKLLATRHQLDQSHEKELVEIEDRLYSTNYLNDVYSSGLRRIQTRAKSVECANYIEFEFMKYFRALGQESPLPFEDIYFQSQCHSDVQKHEPWAPNIKSKDSYDLVSRDVSQLQPYRNYSRTPAHMISILYIMLMHHDVKLAKRIILALIESQHHFIIHIDKRDDLVYEEMLQFANQFSNVYILPMELRITINWGGYSIVNATLIGMRYAFYLDIYYDYAINLSGTTYPIKSNSYIRHALSEYIDTPTIYMDINNEVFQPHPEMWNHWVECDDWLHRVARLAPARGLNMYQGSQWFAIPRYIVHWLINDPLPIAFTEYTKYTSVADEMYFNTMISSSPYCNDARSKNLLFILFDKWENEKYNNHEESKRDERKCKAVDPDVCGRSPTTLTKSYENYLKISKSLFARKFDSANEESWELLNAIDEWRSEDEEEDSGDNNVHQSEDINNSNRHNNRHENKQSNSNQKLSKYNQNSRLNNKYNKKVEYFMITQNSDILNSPDPHIPSELCWEVTPGHEETYLRRCDESSPYQIFSIGSCTKKRSFHYENGQCIMRDKNEDVSFCLIHIGNENLVDQNICLDIMTDFVSHYGIALGGYECSGKWNQLFRFKSDCSISIVQPAETVGKVNNINYDVNVCATTTYDNRNGPYKIASAACVSNQNDPEIYKQKFQLKRVT